MKEPHTMPRKPGKVPSYCLHKASGQAVVRIDGTDHYLGPYGSNESQELYERLLAARRVKRHEQQDSIAHLAAVNHRGMDLTVEQLLALYWQFAKSYYVKDGKPTKELVSMKYAMRPVRQLYASLAARDFGPLALKGVRQHMIDNDLCRSQVNARVNRIKRIFKWAVSEQLVPPSILEGLRSVSGLRYGRTQARESLPVKPVADRFVQAILPFVSDEVSTMIRVQRLTGMRPCEVVQLRMCDIDTSDEIWVFEPADHKNRWRGHRRLVPLGPIVQDLLKPFTERLPTEYMFSPAEAEKRRNHRRREERKSPMTPSQSRRKPKVHAKRPKRDCYDVYSYRRAITYGIQRASRAGVEVEHWHPNQLRHSRATEIRKLHGIEGAQVSLGHARADVTQIYASKNLELAISIARQSG